MKLCSWQQVQNEKDLQSLNPVHGVSSGAIVGREGGMERGGLSLL